MNPVGMVQRDSNDRESSASVGALACRGEQIKDREKNRLKIRKDVASEICMQLCMKYV